MTDDPTQDQRARWLAELYGRSGTDEHGNCAEAVAAGLPLYLGTPETATAGLGS